jgi:hypothetical protein
MKWKEPGRGISRRQDGHRRIIVGFDPETFEQVRALAQRAGVSFSEQTRQLVEFGLEDVRGGNDG